MQNNQQTRGLQLYYSVLTKLYTFFMINIIYIHGLRTCVIQSTEPTEWRLLISMLCTLWSCQTKWWRRRWWGTVSLLTSGIMRYQIISGRFWTRPWKVKKEIYKWEVVHKQQQMLKADNASSTINVIKPAIDCSQKCFAIYIGEAHDKPTKRQSWRQMQPFWHRMQI